MKNIHILPTDKETRLYLSNYGKELNLASHPKTLYSTGQNIYITSDEEIKEWNWMYDIDGDVGMAFGSNQAEQKIQWQGNKKIILTTDQDLIKDGVQAIDDEFLEWFVKNPSCERVEVEDINNKWHTEDRSVISVSVYKLIIPKDEPKQSTKDRILSETPESVKQKVRDTANKLVIKQETPKQHVELINDNIEEFDKSIELFKQKTTLEEVAEKLFPNKMEEYDIFLIGARWQQERSYSEKEVLNMLIKFVDERTFLRKEVAKIWFKQFKKK